MWSDTIRSGELLGQVTCGDNESARYQLTHLETLLMNLLWWILNLIAAQAKRNPHPNENNIMGTFLGRVIKDAVDAFVGD